MKTEIPYILCGAGEYILQHRLHMTGYGYGIEVLADRGVEGCLLSVQADEGHSSFLWRFGVLLAANAEAHAILPDLPLASQAAITAVNG